MTRRKDRGQILLWTFEGTGSEELVFTPLVGRRYFLMSPKSPGDGEIGPTYVRHCRADVARRLTALNVPASASLILKSEGSSSSNPLFSQLLCSKLGTSLSAVAASPFYIQHPLQTMPASTANLRPPSSYFVHTSSLPCSASQTIRHLNWPTQNRYSSSRLVIRPQLSQFRRLRHGGVDTVSAPH